MADGEKSFFRWILIWRVAEKNKIWQEFNLADGKMVNFGRRFFLKLISKSSKSTYSLGTRFIFFKDFYFFYNEGSLY